MGGGGSKVVDVSTLPTVVIVGGGYAGIQLARQLDRHFFVVLIDRKDHFLHKIALLRATVQPERAAHSLLSYARLLTNGVFIQGYVDRIDRSSVHIAGYQSSIPFDVLVVATGSSYAFPARVSRPMRSMALPAFETINKQLLQAQSVLVIGGGAVGVELAAEVATDFPSKKVTLVHSHEWLGVDGLPDKYYKLLLSQLDNLHINLVRNDRVIIPGDVSETLKAQDELYWKQTRTWSTERGASIEADLTFFTTGTKLNSRIVASSTTAPFVAAAVVTDKGELQVNKHFQVAGYSNVYAIGDIANAESQKVAFRAGKQAEYLSKHLPTLVKQGGSTTGVPEYVPEGPAMFLSVGRNAGAGTLNGSVFPSFIVKFIKSKDVFIGKSKGDLNLKKNDRPDVALGGGDVKERVDKLVSKLRINATDAQRMVEGRQEDDGLSAGGVDYV